MQNQLQASAHVPLKRQRAAAESALGSKRAPRGPLPVESSLWFSCSSPSGALVQICVMHFHLLHAPYVSGRCWYSRYAMYMSIELACLAGHTGYVKSDVGTQQK